MALMLLCEFILNSTRAPPGEELLYHTLLELHLMGDEEPHPVAAATAAAAAAAAAAASEEEEEDKDAAPSTSYLPDQVAGLPNCLCGSICQSFL